MLGINFRIFAIRNTLFYFNRNLVSRILMSKSKKKSKEIEVKDTPKLCSPISEDKNGNILLKILAKPGAKLNSITDVSEEGIGIQINAPPLEGEANTELVRYISEILGIRKTSVSLEKGSRSRQKVLMVAKGSLQLQEIETKIYLAVKNST